MQSVIILPTGAGWVGRTMNFIEVSCGTVKRSPAVDRRSADVT